MPASRLPPVREMRRFVASNNEHVERAVEESGERAVLRILRTQPYHPLALSSRRAYRYGAALERIRRAIVADLQR